MNAPEESPDYWEEPRTSSLSRKTLYFLVTLAFMAVIIGGLGFAIWLDSSKEYGCEGCYEATWGPNPYIQTEIRATETAGYRRTQTEAAKPGE